jgi:hypothetical protein
MNVVSRARYSPVELLQRLDLLLQRFALGGQAPDDVLVALLA